ncbi:MAG: hypothetical protein WCA76_22080 [Candidatus Sulfotelmatobacter sp.]|jgi:hypothetical protein
MAGKRFTSVLCLLMLALACGTVFAQSHELKIAPTIAPSKVITPAKATPPALKPIYTNLGPTPTDDYNDTTGYYVLGPTNSIGDSEQWIAVPFTPKADSHVSELEVAVGLISGTPKVVVGLYSDNAGTVGTLLASGASTHIPAYGACCTLVTVHITSTAVTAGTQYWIGVTTDDTKAPDFTGVFQSSNDANTGGNEAAGSWFTFSNNWPAAAALGTVP